MAKQRAEPGLLWLVPKLGRHPLQALTEALPGSVTVCVTLVHVLPGPLASQLVADLPSLRAIHARTNSVDQIASEIRHLGRRRGQAIGSCHIFRATPKWASLFSPPLSDSSRPPPSHAFSRLFYA